MREIKFRGKRIDNGEWVYGFYFTSLSEQEEIVHNIRSVSKEGGYKDYLVDPETVGQFTGLYDKNNVPIYEGDICQSYTFTKSGAEFKEHAMPIVFRDGMFAFGYYSVNLTYFISEYELEVIGNIYDNPSLIKE